MFQPFVILMLLIIMGSTASELTLPMESLPERFTYYLVGHIGLGVGLWLWGYGLSKFLRRDPIGTYRMMRWHRRVLVWGRMAMVGLVAWGGWEAELAVGVDSLGDNILWLAGVWSLLAPALLGWLLSWCGQYEVDRVQQEEDALTASLLGRPTVCQPTRMDYLVLNIRQQWFLAGMVVLSLQAQILLRWGAYVYQWPISYSWLMLLLAIGLLWAGPWLMMRMWWTVPLGGALGQKLADLARRYRVRFAGFRLWRTYNTIPNAAVVGVLPWSRYFLITDRLLGALDDEEVEAVLAHEVGHAAQWHPLWYVIMLMAGSGAMTLLVEAGVDWVQTYDVVVPRWAQEAVSLGALAGFLMVVFTGMARHFEFEADWFAARHMGRLTAEGWARDDGALLTRALVKITSLLHRSPTQKGVLHPSVVQRAEAMVRGSSDPDARRRFEWAGYRLRWAIVALLVVTMWGWYSQY
jgi:Zn-dependent protease with chaperone function